MHRLLSAYRAADNENLLALHPSVIALWSTLHSLEGDDVGPVALLCTTVLRTLADIAFAAARSDPVGSSLVEQMTSRDNLQALLGYLSAASTLATDALPAERACASDRATSACRILGAGASMRDATSQLALAEVGDPESVLSMLQVLIAGDSAKVRGSRGLTLTT